MIARHSNDKINFVRMQIFAYPRGTSWTTVRYVPCHYMKKGNISDKYRILQSKNRKI